MGIITHQYEFTSSISPLRLFKAIVFDSYNLIPRVLPTIVKNVDNIKGDGSKPGDLQRLMFFQENRPDNIKRIDMVDQDNLIYGYTLLEGDFKLHFSNKIEKIGYEYKLETSPDHGFTIIKNTIKYHTIVADQDEIDYEKFDDVKDKASSLFSVIESYLNQQPDFYN